MVFFIFHVLNLPFFPFPITIPHYRQGKAWQEAQFTQVWEKIYTYLEVISGEGHWSISRQLNSADSKAPVISPMRNPMRNKNLTSKWKKQLWQQSEKYP